MHFRIMFYRKRRALQRLHFQVFFRILSTSTVVVSKFVKVYLGWDKGKAPPNSHVLVKKFNETRLHTYVGMLGYCVKDRREDHFEVVHNNVSDEELAIGLEECMKLDTPFAKNKIVSPPKIC